MSGFLGLSSSLLDELDEAEFRGVPFYMPDVREETGRRVVRFLYPGQDANWHEDLGALDGAMRVTGLIIGEDYIPRARRLQAAFRTPGPGLLVHPWLGEMDVVISDPGEISFSQRQLRLAHFSVAFEPFIERAPAKLDTLGELLAVLDALREGARRLLRFALAPIRLALSVVRAVVGFAEAAVGLFTSSISATRGLIALPDAIGATFSDLLAVGTLSFDAGYGSAVAARFEAPGTIVRDAAAPRLAPAIGPFGGTPSLDPLVDPATATRLMLAVGRGLRTDASAPASLRLAAASLMVADAVAIGVLVPFVSRSDAMAMRAQLDTALVDLATACAAEAATDPQGAGGLWQDVRSTRASLARDMSEIIGRLPAVETLTLPNASATWLVAQHLVGDTPSQVTAQYLDLVARNRPRRPARLPGGPIEVLR